MGPGLRKALTLFVFLAPPLAVVTLFFLVPVVLTALLSLTDMHETLRWNFVGLENFRRMLGYDPRVHRIIVNTAIYVPSALAITIGLGLLIALASTSMREGAGILLRTIWFLPNLIPPVVYILLWRWFFDPTRYGFLNAVLALLGQSPRAWLTEYALPIVIVVNALIGASVCMVVFTSAIKSIPPELIMAAQVDGASYLQTVRYVILPLIRWPLMFMTAWHVPAHLNAYVYTLLLTDGGPYYSSEVWALYSYHKAFRYFEYGYGAAISTVLIALNVAAILIVWKVFGLRRMMELGGGE